VVLIESIRENGGSGMDRGKREQGWQVFRDGGGESAFSIANERNGSHGPPPWALVIFSVSDRRNGSQNGVAPGDFPVV
jgi:hypothetical protein